MRFSKVSRPNCYKSMQIIHLCHENLSLSPAPTQPVMFMWLVLKSIICMHLKKRVHTKIKILSSFTHPHVVPNPHGFLSSVELKENPFKSVRRVYNLCMWFLDTYWVFCLFICLCHFPFGKYYSVHILTVSPLTADKYYTIKSNSWNHQFQSDWLFLYAIFES